jgi:hypothetical protein
VGVTIEKFIICGLSRGRSVSRVFSFATHYYASVSFAVQPVLVASDALLPGTAEDRRPYRVSSLRAFLDGADYCGHCCCEASPSTPEL